MHPIFCAHLIIFVGLLNLDISMSTPPLECFHCIFVCNLQFKPISFLYIQTFIMIVHTLKMCMGEAGSEQSLVLFSLAKAVDQIVYSPKLNLKLIF